MHKSLLVASLALPIALLELPAFAQPALLYSYTNPPRFEIRDIHGIVELWHMTEPCSPQVVGGTIESVEYTQAGGDTPKAFRLRMSNGFVEWVGLNAIAEAKFSMIDLAWLGKFFSPGHKVLVMGARCGAAGHELIARDIYDAKYMASVMAASQNR
jgi:hypothetical protein